MLNLHILHARSTMRFRYDPSKVPRLRNQVHRDVNSHVRICIVQSCYIPWKGFFDLIGRCDEFVIYDSAQYAKRHWHNRNRIKTADGVQWLTIPVIAKGRSEQPI